MAVEYMDKAIAALFTLLASERGIHYWRALRGKSNGAAGDKPIDFWRMELRAAFKDISAEQVNILREIRDHQQVAAESLTKLVTIAEMTTKRH